MNDITPIESLLTEFLSLKNDLIKNRHPETYVYLWKDKKGNGIALGGDDTLMFEYDPVVKENLSPSYPRDLVASYRYLVDASLSVEECLEMAIKRLKFHTLHSL